MDLSNQTITARQSSVAGMATAKPLAEPSPTALNEPQIRPLLEQSLTENGDTQQAQQITPNDGDCLTDSIVDTRIAMQNQARQWLQRLQLAEQTSKASKARQYQALRNKVSEDLQAQMHGWTAAGFNGGLPPRFRARLKVLHPKILQRRALLTSLQLNNWHSHDAIANELLNEFIRTCYPLLWKANVHNRLLLEPLLHGRTIRKLALDLAENSDAKFDNNPSLAISAVQQSQQLTQLAQWYRGGLPITEVANPSFKNNCALQQLSQAAQVNLGWDKAYGEDNRQLQLCLRSWCHTFDSLNSLH